MRSTVRIDDDLMLELKEQARREQISLTRLLNRTLRAGLSASCKPVPRKSHYRESTHAMGPPRYGLDQALRLADALNDEEVVRKMMLRK
jgi:hypothetical protein